MKLTAPWFLPILFFLAFNSKAMSFDSISSSPKQAAVQDSVLRHVVLLKFKLGTRAEDIDKVQRAFTGLKSKIPQIKALEWGINNSPEGLDRGFTHCFLLTFSSEEDRDTYLPHPDHKAFGNILGPVLDDVLVVDYWTH